MDVLKKRLVDAIDLTNSLAANLSGDSLKRHNGALPSNTIGGQFWCVVGARESYARAFKAGKWQGFSCSLKDIETPQAVQTALAESRKAVFELFDIAAELTEAREVILITLLEHEAQHHGQLIRYFYANKIDFSTAFAKRYSLEMPKKRLIN